MATRLRPTERELAERLGIAADRLDDTIQQLRTAFFASEPPEIVEHEVVEVDQLFAQVAEVVAASSRVLGLEPEIVLSGEPQDTVSGELAERACAVIREGLGKVAFHAGATNILVEVEVAEELTARVLKSGDAVSAPAGGQAGGAVLEWRTRRCP